MEGFEGFPVGRDGRELFGKELPDFSLLNNGRGLHAWRADVFVIDRHDVSFLPIFSLRLIGKRNPFTPDGALDWAMIEQGYSTVSRFLLRSFRKACHTVPPRLAP